VLEDYVSARGRERKLVKEPMTKTGVLQYWSIGVHTEWIFNEILRLQQFFRQGTTDRSLLLFSARTDGEARRVVALPICAAPTVNPR